MGSNQTILLTRKSKSKYNLLEKLGDVAIMVTIAYRLVCQYCKLLILTSDKDFYQLLDGAAISDCMSGWLYIKAISLDIKNFRIRIPKMVSIGEKL